MADTSGGYDRMPATLAAVLAAFLVAGMLASRWWSFVPQTAAASPDLSAAHIVEVRDATGRTVLSGEFRERVDSLGNPKRDATLSDRRGRRVVGEIEIQLPGPASLAAAQELEIDVIELEPNAKYSLYIDDREVASFTTDDRGSIDMEVQSRPGEQPRG